METSRNSCRVCLSETEFSVSLFGSYSRRTNLVDKILVCLKIVIEESDFLTTICHKCAETVERYHDFIMFVKKSQTKLKPQLKVENSVNRRMVTSYVREQIYDADYTFSFLEMPEEKKEQKPSSPIFSYFSPPDMIRKHGSEQIWKTPKPRENAKSRDNFKRPYKSKPGHHSRDLFESQSQDTDEANARTLDWKLTPDENIIKRVRDKCFGRSDF